eukprot:CAMPEP_0201658610 /NCGR_PEP_ID=MMETSP0494-20130426/1481_1 /ASSEMBLY_ACC=CAM_ASM_000839 /TAXON_ID=420259 /ORGANISM="Thalassiosira gravida, Strain GMp14c1" /LENGTH=1055 /DNA_ID=CAMNT_0048135709 /DNA_START=93 /DNA_END=3260 /DNA_ORIENTATION=+
MAAIVASSILSTSTTLGQQQQSPPHRHIAREHNRYSHSQEPPRRNLLRERVLEGILFDDGIHERSERFPTTPHATADDAHHDDADLGIAAIANTDLLSLDAATTTTTAATKITILPLQDDADKIDVGIATMIATTTATTTTTTDATKTTITPEDDADDATASKEVETTAATYHSPCKSIIAVGATRLPSSYEPRTTPRDLKNPFQDEDDNDGSHVNANDNPSHHGSEEFVCELDDGATIPIHSTYDQKIEMRRALNDGVLVSAVSTIVGMAKEVNNEIKEEVDGSGEFLIAGKPEFTTIDQEEEEEMMTLPPGPIQIQTDPNRRLSHQQRSLARYSGTQPVLVVRVIDKDGRAVPGSAAHISNKIFGTNGDVETMKSQFASCSINNLNIVSNQYGDRNDEIVSKLSAPGVLEVTIPVSLNNSQNVIRSAIQNEVNDALGLRIPNAAFAHVMYVLEGCYEGCGWAAYAYVNSWLSVYQSAYYSMPAVQMHELGHNLNLAHSGGLDQRSYTDHTCLMGNPLFSDDVGDMCFNPAKNYQIVMSGEGRPSGGNWYGAERVETFDTSVDGKSWDGRLVGIAEYDKIGSNSNDRIVLKLETGRKHDLYVGFNRATGFTSDNQMASNQVTITEAGTNGLSYSQSWLKATLEPGSPPYRVANWRESGEELVLTVNSIRKKGTPWYASVSVRLSGQVNPTPSPTKFPTKVPTNFPTSEPSKRPTKVPTKQPTSNPTTNQPSNQPTNRPSTTEPTSNPTDSPTKQPSSSPTNRPSDFPTSSPTNGPTTQNPTSTPTNGPTKISTPPPTSLPTKSPSNQPMNTPTPPPTPLDLQPTSNPTKAPADQPTTLPPSKSPTTQPSRVPTSEMPTSQPTSLTTSEVPTSQPTKLPTNFPTNRPTSNPTEPTLIRLSTPNRKGAKGKNAKGVAFTVQAKKDIIMTGMDIVAKTKADSRVVIYTRKGEYADSALTSNTGWTLVYQGTIPNQKSQLYSLGDFTNEVKIAAGQSQSFYVYSKKRMLYTASESKGSVYSEDDYIAVREGRATRGLFRKPIKDTASRFAGVMRYHAE